MPPRIRQRWFRPHGLSLGLALLGLLAGLALLFSQPGNRAPELSDEAARSQAISAAAARIVADGLNGNERSKPRTVSPSRKAMPTELSLPPSPAVAPQGYSLVGADAQMVKRRMASSELPQIVAADAASKAIDWLRSPNAADDLIEHARRAGRDWSFGWIEHSPNIRLNDIRRALADQGAVVLGTAGNLVRAQLPADRERLAAILNVPGIDGIGAVPKVRKMPESLAQKALEASLHDQIPVFITLMADDPDGRWRARIEASGAIVADFDPDTRAYAAVVSYGILDDLAAADFVLAVEPIGIVEAAHQSAVPAMGADALRVYNRSTGLFSGIGGESVPIAVMDTGLNINHLDIASHRSSICGANLVSQDARAEGLDLWFDQDGHGTHVTGTLAGNGYMEPSLAGMAPSVRHIRFAKVLNRWGWGSDDTVNRGMDYLAQASSCPQAGWSDDRVKALIVNVSLAATSLEFEGRDLAARKLDATVWRHRQLYVVANANSRKRGFSDYGAAKNSLAVGAVRDSGELARFSSRGPTADGRLAPLVVGAGVDLTSALGRGSRAGYVSYSGTSMASPAVAGVAALVMDAARSYRERPALARARLMASAIKPDAWFDHPAGFPLSNHAGPGSIQGQYGMGKVSAHTSVLNRNRPDGWINGASITALRDGEYAYRDITVPAGASRLDLVMTWDEPPADAIASSVLNDLDLWLDEGADCGAGACGEHSSRSRIDNVEWIIVRNPKPGLYRAKVAARRVYTRAPRAALAWTVVRGASTPGLRIAAQPETLKVKGVVKLSLNSDAYVAAGSRLHVHCRSAGSPEACTSVVLDLPDARAERRDGRVRDLSLGTWNLDQLISLGEIAVGETQTIELPISYWHDDAVRLHFVVDAWNATSSAVAVDLLPEDAADGTPASPALAAEVESPANDDFANAASITGDSGAAKVDLLIATTEPGEPDFDDWTGRPFGSVWFEWQAPASGPYRFELVEDDPEELVQVGEVRLDVFAGSQLAGLKRIASAPWGGAIFAEQGTVYRLRASHQGRPVPLTLRWAHGPRPENDDFAAPVRLTGASGSVAGTNLGATTELGEAFAGLAATTWFAWRAPSDGAFRFEASVDSLKVLVFTGNRMGELRLVSGLPNWEVSFRAERGALYRIAVATPDAFDNGRAFELSWAAEERELGYDDFEGAIDMGSEASSSHYVTIDQASSVQPGEPLETGIRTTWHRWTAPMDGRFTWRLDETSSSALQLAMFRGAALTELQLIGRTGPGIMATEFTVEVADGETYWLALGYAANDSQAYSLWSSGADATLHWGPTPSNDALASAAQIGSVAGNVSGSNRFATSEQGERGGQQGHSSLWWTFEPSTSGWYRFSLAEEGFALAVYGNVNDSVGALNLIRVSAGDELADATDIVFHAEAGQRYAIRLGSTGAAAGGEFTLSWTATEAPVWLRHVGSLTHFTDDEGALKEVRDASLAFDPEGARLYAATAQGLQVFEREADTGGLTFRHALKSLDLSDAALVWDANRSRLIAKKCETWRSFTWNDESRQAHAQDVFNVPDGQRCASGLFMDDRGDFLYSLNTYNGIDVFAATASGQFRHVEYIELPELTRAVLSSDNSLLYAVTRWILVVFERDAQTGRLSRVDGYEQALSYGDPVPIAVTDDGQHLFLIDEWGARTNLFDLGVDAAKPELVGSLPKFWPEDGGWVHSKCHSAAARAQALAVDVMCDGSAYSVRMKDGELKGTDHISPVQADRYNNPVRDFGVVGSTAFSPDGKHVYLSTQRRGIVILERVGG